VVSLGKNRKLIFTIIGEKQEISSYHNHRERSVTKIGERREASVVIMGRGGS
jgi:hypothetical protein